jgi:hypothetical protein
MKTIIPKKFTVEATSVATSIYSPWSENVTYGIGDKVYMPDRHREYESLLDDNIGNEPSETGDDNWLSLGFENAYRMFDTNSNSHTVALANNDELFGAAIHVILIADERVSSVVFLGLINITAIDFAISDRYENLIAQYHYPLETQSSPVGAWSYFFRDPQYSNNLTIDSIDIPKGSRVFIRFFGVNIVAIAQCLLGVGYTIGETLWETEPTLIDYSGFTTNDFGETLFVKRQVVNQCDYNVICDTDDFDRIYNLFYRQLMNTLAVFDGNNEITSNAAFCNEPRARFSSLVLYGKVDAFRPTLNFRKTGYDLRVIGLVEQGTSSIVDVVLIIFSAAAAQETGGIVTGGKWPAASDASSGVVTGGKWPAASDASSGVVTGGKWPAVVDASNCIVTGGKWPAASEVLMSIVVDEG